MRRRSPPTCGPSGTGPWLLSKAAGASRRIRPSRCRAARIATEQATARYQSGLGTIDQVAEAQRLRTQAEIDDALARLGVWRALLGIAAAAGDIQPFVAEASR